MKSSELKHISITIPDPIQSTSSLLSQKDPIDYNLLINKPTSSGSFFAYDVFSSAGAAADATFRDINIIGSVWDLQVSYSTEIIVGRGSTTAQISNVWTIRHTSTDFTFSAGSVIRVQAYLFSASDTLRMSLTGSYRNITPNATDLTSTNYEKVILATTSLTLKFQYATTAGNRPIFGYLLEVL